MTCLNTSGQSRIRPPETARAIDILTIDILMLIYVCIVVLVTPNKNRVERCMLIAVRSLGL